MGKKLKGSSSTSKVPVEQLYKAIEEEISGVGTRPVDGSAVVVDKNYRRAAIQHYRREIEGDRLHVCVMCGFGIKAILEVAHLSQDRSNNALDNLAVLCPNCHKMHDIGLIPSDVVRAMRDFAPSVNWKARIKDAGQKAAATRLSKAAAVKRSATAKKAAAKRKQNQKTPSPARRVDS